MNHSIRFLSHSSGIKIPYFTDDGTLWIGATEVAKLLNYAKPQGAIKRHVSLPNQKKLSEFQLGARIPGLQLTRIFMNFHGLQELLQQNSSHPLATTWSTPARFLEIKNETNELSFSNISEIPETISKPLSANGFIYLLRWNRFGKVGKTRSFRNRKQALQQKFKEGEVIWFCFCENIDILEQEILQKLEHIGALIKHPESTEIFDPEIISFEEVRTEIQRFANQINSQWSWKNERQTVQQEYLKFATTVFEPLIPFAKEDPKTYISVLEKILDGFEKI